MAQVEESKTRGLGRVMYWYGGMLVLTPSLPRKAWLYPGAAGPCREDRRNPGIGP